MLWGEWDAQYKLDGVPVKLGTDTEREADELRLDIGDVIQGMREGTKCSKQWDRPRDCFEKCFRFAGKIIRVVYCESYWRDEDCDCLFVKHIGEVYE